MKKKVLVASTNFSLYCKDAKKLLEENGFEIVENTLGRPLSHDDLAPIVSDIFGVIAGVDVWDEKLFSKAPELKILTRFGVGLDNFDLQAAKKHGVMACHARAMNANAVAESAVAMILNAMKGIPHLTDSLREGEWERFMGEELTGKTVGLLGFGAIGQRVAQMLQGFEVKLYAFDKYPNKEIAEKYHVTMTEAETILKTCDIISMHLPSLPETHHYMNRETFGKLKDGSYFVNTARGALVDESALLEAVKYGKLRGASLDVYEEEPAKPSNPLLHLPNVFCTPHTAAETEETYRRISLCCAKQIMAVANGEVPEFLVNP
jgi:D-3-phosphoglycerate dehydrogenase